MKLHVQEEIQDSIEPHLAECVEASGRLLRRFKPEFRCPAGGRRQLSDPHQFSPVVVDRAAICLAEKDCFIASGSVAKIRLEPIDQA